MRFQILDRRSDSVRSGFRRRLQNEWFSDGPLREPPVTIQTPIGSFIKPRQSRIGLSHRPFPCIRFAENFFQRENRGFYFRRESGGNRRRREQDVTDERFCCKFVGGVQSTRCLQ